MNKHDDATGHRTRQAEDGLSPAMRRTAGFLAVGVGLLLLGGWLNVQPSLRQRAVVGEAEQAKVGPDPVGDLFQGGSFCSAEFTNDAKRAGP